MLDLIIIGLGSIGLLGGLLWHSINNYFKNKRLITYPVIIREPIIDPIPYNVYQQNEIIPTLYDTSTLHNTITSNDTDIPPKYEDINLHN